MVVLDYRVPESKVLPQATCLSTLHGHLNTTPVLREAVKTSKSNHPSKAPPSFRVSFLNNPSFLLPSFTTFFPSFTRALRDLRGNVLLGPGSHGCDRPLRAS